MVSPVMNTSSSTGITNDNNTKGQSTSTLDNDVNGQHKKLNVRITLVSVNKKTVGGDSCSCQTYSKSHKTFMAELQFMLQEFKKLEQQIL